MIKNNYFFIILGIILIGLSSASELVERTEHSDIYKNTDGTYTSHISSQKINMMDLEGNMKPYEEVTTFKETNDALEISWNDKYVRLVFKGIDKNPREGMASILNIFGEKELNLKKDLDMTTNIKKNRGHYYFDHRMNAEQLKEFYYDIETSAGVDCYFERSSLICDEQQIDFSEAVNEQGLTVEGTKNKIVIKGEDLSYIDPEVSIAYNDTGMVRFDYSTSQSCPTCDPYSIYNFTEYIGNEGSPSYQRKISWYRFPLNFSRGIDVIDLDFQTYFQTLDGDCSSTMVNIYEMDDETTNFYPSEGDEEGKEYIYNAAENGTEYTNISLTTEGTWQTADLGSNADEKLSEVSFTNYSFVLGFGDDYAKDASDSDSCEFKIRFHAINVTYNLSEDIPPITTATAKVLPFYTTYSFGSETPYSVNVSLSCYDANSSCKPNYPRYCVDTANTCTPTTIGNSTIISNEGINYIRYYSEDTKYNVENISSSIINISRDYESLQIRINETLVFNTSENFFDNETVEGIEEEINAYLGNCTGDGENYCLVPIKISSTIDKNISVHGLAINYDVTEYSWNNTDYEDTEYRIRIKLDGDLWDTEWSNSSDFSLKSSPPFFNTNITYPVPGLNFTNVSTIKINWTEAISLPPRFVRYFLEYTNNSGVNWYNIISNFGLVNTFDDDSTNKTLELNASTLETVYVRIPKNSTVTEANINWRGYNDG